MIHDLKNANSQVRSASSGVEVALARRAGVAKAKADHVTIAVMMAVTGASTGLDKCAAVGDRACRNAADAGAERLRDASR